MKTESDVRKRILEYYESGKHILEQTPKDVQTNAYVALSQCADTSYLEALYWVLGEERPKMKCDDFSKRNY
jgi:hypothetical protein